VKVRVNADDTERLDVVAARHQLAVSGLVRWLIKREYDAIRTSERALDGLDPKDYAVTAALGTLPKEKFESSFELTFLGFPAREVPNWLDARLEKLCRLAYIERTADGYLLTPKGIAAREGLLQPARLRRLVVPGR